MATCLDLCASILNSGDQSGIHSKKEWHRHILEGQKSLIERRMAGRVIWSDSNTYLKANKVSNDASRDSLVTRPTLT